MALPHREYSDLVVRTLVGYDNNNTFNIYEDFTSDHIEIGHIGNASVAGPMYYQWKPLIKSLSTELDESLDQVIDYGFFFTVTLLNNTPGCTSWRLTGFTNRYPDPGEVPDTWDKDLVTGRRYDGVQRWAGYPQHGSYQGVENQTLIPAGFPYSLVRWIEAYQTGCRGNQYAPVFVRNGLSFIWSNWAGCGATPWAPTEYCDGYLIPHKFRINFLNAVCNSINRRWIKTGTNPTLIFYGLGFNQDDDEVCSSERYSLNSQGIAWNSLVDYIYLIGQQGQGTFTMNRVAGDFIVNSDNQITTVNLPNLPEGTYEIRFHKAGVGPASCVPNVYSYAGDFRADENGLCVPGPRMTLLVQEKPPKNEDLMFLTEWQFKKGDLIISKYFAPIDIRSTKRFYDGRIIGHSPLVKSVDDDSGLPNIADMTIELANNDKEFSKLLAEYDIKNQLVALFNAWKHNPESWKTHTMVMIVDDWELQGNKISVSLKDFSQKFFKVSIPRYIITAEEYPAAHENALTKPMQEILGRAYLNGALKGAVEAHCVDTANFKYLAARGSLHSITEVFSENVLQVEGAGNDYTISYEDGGRTYINFNADQGDKRITFNCCGYMLADWNSANGYVQNPSYVIAFLISLIGETPINFMDIGSFDNLAELFEELGWDEAGYLILQDFQEMENTLTELLFTYGIKIFPDIYGRFKVGKKDITNYETTLRIYDQIDTMEPVRYPQNLREMYNRVKAVWGYFPCQSLSIGSIERVRQSSVNTFDVEIESSPSPLEFKWTSLENVVISRVNDELLKKGFGNRKANFSVSTDWVNRIDIFDNFQLQDLFALDVGGEGAEGHYFYIESLGLDFVSQRIEISAIDLQWLIRQCMIIGVCSELAEQWANASDWQRMFGYIAFCLTEKFSDGEDAKKICPC